MFSIPPLTMFYLSTPDAVAFSLFVLAVQRSIDSFISMGFYILTETEVGYPHRSIQGRHALPNIPRAQAEPRCFPLLKDRY